MNFIYHFSQGIDLDHNILPMLGNKGANLARMCALGLNVPEGFIISSKLCEYYYQNNKTLPNNFHSQLKSAVILLEQKTNKQFGGAQPLLLAVRSGANVSMPGMMDTVLNVGINRQTQKYLALQTSENFASDCLHRFLEAQGIGDISAESVFEERVYQQLYDAIIAVLDSWCSARAITYRQIHNICESCGTAIVVQRMVFGNIEPNYADGIFSGTGVVFSRSPINGEKKMYGEFILCAQGEDIVSGRRTPVDISDLAEPTSMQKIMPQCYVQLKEALHFLEQNFGDMQDVEFTVQNNQLYILQTRSGKRSATAAIKIATDMVFEGLKTKQEAIKSIDPESLSQLMHLSVDYTKPTQEIGFGLPASPGAACGAVVFSSKEAQRLSPHMPVILVRQDTSPEDIEGMHHAAGILTSRGGMTSHAAVVARGMGKPCITGAQMHIDFENQSMKIQNTVICASQYITIDGSSGKVLLGASELISQKMGAEFNIFMQWVDEFRGMKVRANAENALDIQAALEFGAEGIGLCRTEHMLFEPERLRLMRQIILAEGREKLSFIEKLFFLHKSDFKEIFKLCAGISVNVRLFDPPLHEFLPFEDFANIAQNLGMHQQDLEDKIAKLQEVNPMLGHRGSRLGITLPELYDMQARAIFEAAIEVRADEGIEFNLEIMLPFIAMRKELEILLARVKRIAKNTADKFNLELSYKLGVMIELPRSALLADQFAPLVDYFSFGTNDLTQMTFGLSRDDMASFAHVYKEQGIFAQDPFVSIDSAGVGALIQMACVKGKGANSNLSLSVCGEHGGDPVSIRFFNQLGLNYVSCSPFRVIIAKLAAAQANL